MGGPRLDPKQMEELMQKSLAVLTSGQKSKWKEMTGKEFKLPAPPQRDGN